MSYKNIKPDQTIGIIGGGQLGRMLSFAAKQMGYRVAVLDPKENCPAAQVSDFHICAPFHDQIALQELYNISDVLTYEFENVPHQVLEPFIDKIPQGLFPLKFTQDRLLEKETIQKAGFETVPYLRIDTQKDLKKACEKLGYPVLLKTRSGGYDGKGQQFIHHQDIQVDINGPSILEKVIELKQEASLIVTRSIHHEVKLFPVIDNVHRAQRLVESSIPTSLSEQLMEKVLHIGKRFAEKIDLIGTLAIEFFITTNNEILINECAPRVHNSGHLTIEACQVSQFEQHIRTITGHPLKETNMIYPALMVNIYGQDYQASLDVLANYPNIHYHLYGKKEMKKNRKIGHLTICTKDIEQREHYRNVMRNILNKDV